MGGSVFLDFTEAFVTVDHVVLFNKVESYGITGPGLTLLKSYLLNREHTVHTRNISSIRKCTKMHRRAQF